MKESDLYAVLKKCNKHHIALHYIKKGENNTYTCIIHPLYYYKIKHLFPELRYQYTLGLSALLRLYVLRKDRLFGLVAGLCLFFVLNQMTFGYHMDDLHQVVTPLLEKQIQHFKLDEIAFSYDSKQLEEITQQIYKELYDYIDYLDIYKQGKYYRINYEVKDTIEKTESIYLSLVSKRDAVVDKIEVSRGNVLVKKGQYVNKGEVLVSNEIISSDESIKEVEVEGKVYGYVYYTLEANTNGNLDPETFLALSTSLYKQIDLEIEDDGYIVDENVLQYEKKGGKIVLKMQFTLYQNIAQREFMNES